MKLKAFIHQCYITNVAVIFVFCFAVIFIFSSRNLQAQVRINEVLAANTTFNYDPQYYNFSAWIELHNTGTTAKNIGGYYLSDSKTNKTKWVIPVNTSVAANSYLIIWCDNRWSGIHTNFDIDTDGEGLYFYTNTQVYIDSVRIPKQFSNVSYGRIANGTSWGYLLTPTPAAINSSTNVSGELLSPTFSQPSGRYTSSISLALTSIISNTQIRYTIDGSEPTQQSSIYTAPISISSTTVVKAKVYTTFAIPSETVTRTYLINEHASSLPVVSVSMNPSFLWDNTIGMYVTGTNGINANCGYTANWNRDLGRYCVIELFNKNGTSEFKKDFETKIFGGCSRSFFDQKSLAFYARGEFGKGHLEYPLFPAKVIDKFDGFVLRNSGNDFNFAQFRDALMQTILKDKVDVDWQAFQPAVVYLNGAYWGIMNLREKLNENYVEHNAKIDADSIDFLEKNASVLQGSNSEYVTFVNQLGVKKLWEKETFDYIDANIDVTEFINYYIAQIYYANTDWPGNNIKFWQPKKLGGKWRWMLFDTDFGLGLVWDVGKWNNPDDRTLHFVTDSTTTTGWPNPQWSTLLFRRLLKNPTFRERFIQTFQTSITSVFDPARINYFVDSISALYATEMVYHKAKWGGTITDWNNEVQLIKTFAGLRYGFMPGYLNTFFNLTQTLANIRTSVSPLNTGYVLLNNIRTADSDMLKIYKLMPYSIKAVPANGYRFKQWKIKAGLGVETTSTTIAFSDTAKSDINFIAEFEAKPSISNIFINEIAAKNSGIKDNYGNTDDWFELYNANSDSIDLTGLYLTDNFTRKNKFQIRNTGAKNTKIAPLGYSVFWADEEEYQGNMHTSFKLSGSGERLGVYQISGADTLVIDTISFNIQSDLVSYIRFPDGSPGWFSSSTFTPISSNIKTATTEFLLKYTDESRIRIFPNPTRAFITIGLSNKTANTSYIIYNCLGKVVLSGKLDDEQIDCTYLKPGVYLILINDKNRHLSCGFLKD